MRRQMHRLLNTSHFKNSRRYPALFKFIVEETLEGRGEFLKERLLGVQVFSRSPDYDTASDPIVRVTVAEIRKRIAQYYHEDAHDGELRIELLPGRYEPEFYPRRARLTAIDEVAEAEDKRPEIQVTYPTAATLPLPPAVEAKPPEKRKTSILVRVIFCLSSAAVAALLFVAGWRMMHPSAIDEFWKPVIASHRSISVCLPSQAAGSKAAADAGIISSAIKKPQNAAQVVVETNRSSSQTFLYHETAGENVVFSDVLATLKISNWLARNKRDSRLRLDGLTTLDDLQQGPDVLIGGLDNSWTLRALSRLRYRFSGTDAEQYWILDAKNPSARKWQLDLKTQYPAVKRDYALIARIHDDSMGEIQVIAAGIGMSGTAAAGEFLVDPGRLEELRRRVGPGFRDHNFEAVLGTDVVDGIPGTPEILAVAVW